MPATGTVTPNEPGHGAQARMMLGAGIGMFLNPSPLVLLSFGVYLLPIVHDTGWGREFVSSAVGAALLLIGLSPPAVGWLINRYGPHRISTIGFPLFGVGIMLLSLPRSPAMFVVAMAAFGVLAACQTSVVYIYCLSGWFDKRRGMAQGVGMACSGLALALTPPFAVWLMHLVGWRGTYLAVGLIVVLIGVPVSRWLVLDPPVIVGKAHADIPGIPFRKALRSRVFWLLALIIFLVGASASGGMLILNLLLVERGIPPQQASFVMSLLGITMIVSRLGFGALFDRMSGRVLTALICAAVGTAFLVLGTRADAPGVMIAAALIGVGFGAEGDALSYMTSRAFGMRDFGTIFGTIFLAFTAGGGVGPVFFSIMHARTGDYRTAIWIAAGACTAATMLALAIRGRDLPYSASREPLSEDTANTEFATF